MQVVDLKFKKAVEKFIHNNNLDLYADIHCLIPGQVASTAIQRLLSNDDTKRMLYGIAMLSKLLDNMKIKSPKFTVEAPIKLNIRRVSDTDVISFVLEFVFTYSSAVPANYILYELIYPRINTILLVIHEKYDVVFGIPEFPMGDGTDYTEELSRTQAEAESVVTDCAEDSTQAEAESVVTDCAVFLDYIVFPCPKNSFLPVCSIVRAGASGYDVVTQGALISMQNRRSTSDNNLAYGC